MLLRGSENLSPWPGSADTKIEKSYPNDSNIKDKTVSAVIKAFFFSFVVVTIEAGSSRNLVLGGKGCRLSNEKLEAIIDH